MEIDKIMLAGGTIDLREQSDLRKDLISTAQKIRAELGDKSKLLDDLILSMLTAFDKMSVLNAVDEGFQETADELRHLIKCFREEDSGVLSHPFYPILKAYIEKHLCPAEGIYIDYYCAGLFFDYAEFALKKYMENREASIREAMEEAGVDILKARLAELADPVKMEHLYELMYKRFLLASPSKIFLQCMTDQYILNCLMQDKAGRYVYQHMLDNE